MLNLMVNTVTARIRNVKEKFSFCLIKQYFTTTRVMYVNSLSALDGGVLSTSRPGRSTCRDYPAVSVRCLGGILGGPHSRSGLFAEENISCPIR